MDHGHIPSVNGASLIGDTLIEVQLSREHTATWAGYWEPGLATGNKVTWRCKGGGGEGSFHIK